MLRRFGGDVHVAFLKATLTPCVQCFQCRVREAALPRDRVLCLTVTPDNVRAAIGLPRSREQGELLMTTAIRSMLIRCCLVLGTLCLALSLSGVGHVAVAQQSEDLWKEVQDRGVLRVGAALAPPHVMRDPKTGEYSGIFVDLVKEFGEQVLGVKVEFVDTTWDNLIAGMQAGKWDVAPALNRTAKRALSINYSIAPWQYEISFVFNKANPKIKPEWKSMADFDKDGITMSVMSGTAQDHTITDQIKHATIMRLPDVDAARLAVSSRRADISVDDADTNMLFAAVNKDWSNTVKPDPSLAKQGVAYGFRKAVSLEQIQAFDIFLQEAVAEGHVAKLGEFYVNKVISAGQ
jgi:polar amino acid transport system substrate-binding protein